jgi:glycerophosphoryl diester phosphodiesterase
MHSPIRSLLATPARPALALAALAALVAGCATMPAPSSISAAPERKPLVIAHRGASALRPEHTLEAYRKAIEDGADTIEPDLVSTRDGVLVARHENEISGTTDVAARPEFASRRTAKTIDGERVEGWFTEDFTLAELKTLRARERLPQLRSTAWDGQFPVPTLAEIIDLVAAESARRGRVIGLAPELKHPTHFATLGLAMEPALLDALRAHPYTRSAPVLIQSFETANLRALRGQIGRGDNLRLLQLLGAAGEHPYDTVAAGTPRTYAEMTDAAGLAEIAEYADAICPHWGALAPQPGSDGRTRSRLVEDAHAAGLQVVVYTYRPENHFLGDDAGPGGPAARHEAGSVRQIRAHLALGIDAFFTDDPAVGRRAVDGD